MVKPTELSGLATALRSRRSFVPRTAIIANPEKGVWYVADWWMDDNYFPPDVTEFESFRMAQDFYFSILEERKR